MGGGNRYIRGRMNETTRPTSPTPDTPTAVFAVDRAIGDLRRGGMVVLRDAQGAASLALSPEFVADGGLDALAALGGAVSLVLSGRRAEALDLAPRAPGGGAPVVVGLPLAGGLTTDQIRDLADPTGPTRLPGAARALSPGVPHGRDLAAVALAKLANLLPAMLTSALAGLAGAEVDTWAARRDLLVVDAAQIDEYQQVAVTTLRQVSHAHVPLRDAEDTAIIAFRPASGGTEHLAIVIGEPDSSVAPVLARLHSQCFTGDLLGSLRCDCGDQLRGAIREIAAAGAGVVLYLAQEGRGIGLVNKLRAYQLQDQGLDTFEANEQLGFDADERHYLVAAEMLRQLGFTRIRLMTNNPHKIESLGKAGIAVIERVAHAFPSNGHNQRYLATKAARAGHLL